MNWSQGFISFCCSVLILVAALSVGYEHLGAQLQASVPPQPVQCVESSDRMVNPGSKLQLPPKSTAFSSRHMKSLSTLFSNVKFGIIGRLKRLKSKLKTILVSFHRRPIIVESRESSLNTHMPINVYEIGLEDWKLNLINTAMRELEQTRHKWQAAADETSILVDEYLVFRYLAACDWGPYNGMRYISISFLIVPRSLCRCLSIRVSEAIMETVHWRKDFGIHKIFEEHLVPYSQMHVAYVSPTPDSHGRSVLYLKPGRLTEPIPADLYLQLLLLSVDRLPPFNCYSLFSLFVCLSTGRTVTVFD